MKRELAQTEIAVDTYLESLGMCFTGTGGQAHKREDWDCFAWDATFTPVRGNPERFDYYTGTGHVGKAPDWMRDMNVPAKPIAPSAASVIHSLLCDASCGDQSFNDFCANTGASNDSIKAFDTYRACMYTAVRLAKLFTGEQRDHLSTLLQDY